MAVFNRSLLLLTLIGFASCGTGLEEQVSLAEDLRPSTRPLSRWDGTPGGMALIEFLNERTTTEEVLDDEIALDARAAGNIIAHRDGGDGEFNTTDDDLFDSIAELDRVRWVGPTTIRKMIRFIDNMERIPEYDETLGTWDGVRFTVDQAQATLRFTNNASEWVLDHELDLDRRAVRSILENRPVGTIAHLASLYYVGKGALKTLRKAAEDERN